MKYSFFLSKKYFDAILNTNPNEHAISYMVVEIATRDTWFAKALFF